jgi:hypothetical protein
MTMQNDTPLKVMPERLAVCRLAADAPNPEWAQPGDLLALIRTRDEFTVVCSQRYVPPEATAERGFRALMVQGPLDFNQIGVLAAIAAPLAAAAVSILALSTFDTDFLLVRDESLERAVSALAGAGFLVLNYVNLST